MLTPITAQITYNQFLIDNPTFWDDRIEAGDIDEASVAYIQKWFGRRIVCDDFNFDIFFDRQLDLVLPRYNKLIRLENTEFDAMVNAYRERQITGTGSETTTGSADKTKTGTVDEDITKSKTETPNLTETETGSKNVDKEHEDTRTPNLVDEQKGTEINRTLGAVDNTKGGKIITDGSSDTAGVGKTNPQSISYQGAAVGSVPNLDWQYPSTQTQTEGTNHTEESYNNYVERTEYDDYETEKSFNGRQTEHKGTETNEGTASEDTTTSRTKSNTGTKTTAETEARDVDTSETESTDTEGTKSTSDLIREIWTGRDQLTPQEALKSAMNYVKTSSAFAWLKDQLEVCFLSVYDI